MALTKVTTNMLDANAITLGTQTTGNYVATLADAGNSRITIANSGAETAAVTLDIANDAIDAAQIADGAVGTAALASTIAAGIPTATVGSNANATANTHHYVSTAGVTLTLPTPTVGMKVYVTVGSSVNTIIGRNSSTIAGLAEDLTIDVANMSIGLVGISTSAWVFI